MRQRKPKRLGNYLRGCSGSKELAAADRHSTCAAPSLRSVFKRTLLLRLACYAGLNLACIFARFGKQGDSARNEDARQRSGRSQRHHHRGQTFIAGRHSDNAFARWQGTHQPPEHDGCVVTVGQRIQHPIRNLGAAVPRIGACSGEWNAGLIAKLACSLSHQQPYLPMAGVEAKSDGRSVLRAHSTMSAEDQKLRVEQARRIPTHSGTLTQPKEIARGLRQQHLRSDGKHSLRARSVSPRLREEVGRPIVDLLSGHRGPWFDRHGSGQASGASETSTFCGSRKNTKSIAEHASESDISR